MSLDFYLYPANGEKPKIICPYCSGDGFLYESPEEVYWANYTHNVSPIVLACCYDALYNSAGHKAKEITAALKYGLYHMRNYPELYIPLGDYKTAMDFLEKTLKACMANPEGIIGVSK